MTNDDDMPQADNAADTGESSQASEPANPARNSRASRRARAGRPGGEFLPKVADLLIDIVASGGYLTTATRAVGITASTVERWRRLNPEFSSRLEAAEARCESKLVALVSDAAPSDWRAAIALMKSRWPERWSERRLDLAGDSSIGQLFQVSIHLGEEALRVSEERNRLSRSARPVEVEKPAIEVTDLPAPVGEPRN